jgi:formylglycine-generating enzyme required for sulfatase activity
MNDMVYLNGGTFLMGSNTHYPEEAPAHQVSVSPFWIDKTPVTNLQFKQFVEATGYITFAELPPNPNDYPGAPAHMLQPGSLLFVPPLKPTDLTDWSWWKFEFGTTWRNPQGPESTIHGLDDHPVVHIAYCDALAYASWRGKSLPSEAEWEYAARGTLEGCEFAWGDELTPLGKHMANTWQGDFPYENTMEDGYSRTSPVKTFPPNDYGLYDMIGNVWEWTADFWSPTHQFKSVSPCCIRHNPRGGAKNQSYDPAMPEISIPRQVLKGGSHLCAPNYCRRYRPAARHPEAVDTSSSHIGFRCVIRA